MQIISKLSITAALVSAALAQIVTVGQPTGSFQPGTFGQTFSDGGYVSAGVANPFAGAGVGLNGGFNSGSYGGSYPGGFSGYGPPSGGFGGPPTGGFGGDYPPVGGYGGFQNGAFEGPAPAPIGTGYGGGFGSSGFGGGIGLNAGVGAGVSGGLQPPPPPIYTAGTTVNNGVSGGNINPPNVNVGAVTHNGGFRNHKRQIVTVGQPTASFVPGTFGASFSDGGYVSAGVPNYAQLAAYQSGYYGVPAAYGSAYPYVKLRQ